MSVFDQTFDQTFDIADVEGIVKISPEAKLIFDSSVVLSKRKMFRILSVGSAGTFDSTFGPTFGTTQTVTQWFLHPEDNVTFGAQVTLTVIQKGEVRNVDTGGQLVFGSTVNLTIIPGPEEHSLVLDDRFLFGSEVALTVIPPLPEKFELDLDLPLTFGSDVTFNVFRQIIVKEHHDLFFDADILNDITNQDIELIKNDSYKLNIVVREGGSRIIAGLEDLSFYIYSPAERIIISKNLLNGLEIVDNTIVGFLESEDTNNLWTHANFEIRLRYGNIHKTLIVGDVKTKRTVSELTT